MTAPIDGFEPITPLETPNYSHLNVTSLDQATAIVKAFAEAESAGLIANGTTLTNSQGFRLSITSPAGVDSVCTTGDWIVLGRNGSGTMVSFGLYNGPDGTFDNPKFSDHFPVPAS